MKTLFIAMALSFLTTLSAAQSATDKKTQLIEVDERGNKQYHKQKYSMENNKICPVDVFGKREYHKSYIELSKK